MNSQSVKLLISQTNFFPLESKEARMPLCKNSSMLRRKTRSWKFKPMVLFERCGLALNFESLLRISSSDIVAMMTVFSVFSVWPLKVFPSHSDCCPCYVVYLHYVSVLESSGHFTNVPIQQRDSL